MSPSLPLCLFLCGRRLVWLAGWLGLWLMEWRRLMCVYSNPVAGRSYYEADQRQGASLIRARKPYLVKNALTGLAIVSFTLSVCTLIFTETGEWEGEGERGRKSGV